MSQSTRRNLMPSNTLFILLDQNSVHSFKIQINTTHGKRKTLISELRKKQLPSIVSGLSVYSVLKIMVSLVAGLIPLMSLTCC